MELIEQRKMQKIIEDNNLNLLFLKNLPQENNLFVEYANCDFNQMKKAKEKIRKKYL